MVWRSSVNYVNTEEVTVPHNNSTAADGCKAGAGFEVVCCRCFESLIE